MRQIILFIFIAGILLSCQKDKSKKPVETIESIELQIETVANGSSYTIQEEFINHSGYKVRFEALSFYLSDIYLFNQSGDSLLLSEIELITLNQTENPISIMLPAEEGVYNKIKFGIGVVERLNGTSDPLFDASKYDPGHPLNVFESGMYWTWSSGYRFVALDGKCDITGNDILDQNISIHTGPTQFYRKKEFTKSISIEEGKSSLLQFELDVYDLFTDGVSSIDLGVDSEYHGSGDVTLPTTFSNLFQKSLRLK